ncbi:MAG: hypothetical protein GWN55_11785, partial [Phycisphaerae bacterium]|nr:hypothetical protein [Phycisphaerae bacterium]NIR66343.1 hypothetical protein [candidate division Zixibacteria bacterium]NIU27645.1 hypothetical protein [candidate division KSB1 bacterium]NIS54396.1 hypothetical protein [Phycisphaerae bacterium]NIV01980.1 hypothetical protein [Phycisphaerae bacterium]
APNVITANDGADGGASSFGALLSATGGKGGQGAYIKNGYGGIGGLGSLGLYNSKGEEGANGATKNNFEQYRTNDERNIDILTDEFNTGYSGRGGMPALGGQYGEGVAIGNDGNDGEYGAGGSGGASENSVSLQDGGDGGDGLVIVFW